MARKCPAGKTASSSLEALPQSIREQLSYRRPMRVTRVLLLQTARGPAGYALCPRCSVSLEREYAAFCDRCGQKLDWSSYHKAQVVFPSKHITR